MKPLIFCLLVLCAGVLISEAASLNIPIEKHTLKNGMRVIFSRDTSVPVVSVYLIYGVGARNEEKGRTGFAHLFEHMMFQGSKNAPKGMHFKLVESNGGSLNGSTHPDYTDYFEVLPSNKLALGLWLEADRMRALAINQENLDNQKEAVKQERRLSFDNQPYATAIVDRWPELAFNNWQNAHSIIGSFEDLNAATVEDVARFFKTYYAPNNAVLVISGDFDTAEAKKLVETYFGDIPAQQQPKAPDLTEPPRTQPKYEVYRDPLARVPAVIIGYPGPVRRSADYNALVMLDLLLTGGDSSRFQQNLVKGKKSVIQYEANLGWPFASASDYKDPGLYAMYLLYNPAFTGEQIVAQVEEEIAKIINEGVDAKELERARTFLRATRFQQLQSSHARAALLGRYELLDGKPELINTELNDFLAVTADQIRAAAKKYCDPGKRIVLDIVPAPPAPEKPEDKT
ncbi:MAG TPA: pitrilysin family protein [Bryobacteraceae bacterium]|nr:pitrilysin family protein [Bryobacteraceae bacterium]HOL70886.1 pitrilysin family protein [Bryobacteraceae bacterium]HOQ44574.1 pitrilysin family protein [Bryobacteraceae bacterium]HPQ14404.1 pitrilysin family protein [Bryobacteraceae bacterium]HPU70893.1 pitrilysin family protein [Bryobacteraceae bacterium]